MACIYCITNKTNGKRYVGKTAGCPAERWRGHVYAAKQGAALLLSHAIRKYGAESFTVDILETCENTPDVLNERERHWIATLHTYVKDPNGGHGYNMTLGGDGASAGEHNIFFGRTHTPETRAKISAANTGKVRTEEHKRAISASGRGRKRTIETRARMSQAKDAIKRPVEQLALDGALIATHGSVTAAARALRESDEWPKAHKGNIRAALQGSKDTMYGYCWRYAAVSSDTSECTSVPRAQAAPR